MKNQLMPGNVSAVFVLAVILFAVASLRVEGFLTTRNVHHASSTIPSTSTTIRACTNNRRTLTNVPSWKRSLKLTTGLSFVTSGTFLKMSGTDEDGVVELADTTSDDAAGAESTETDAEPTMAVAPFLSQGEISEEAMEMDWKDPKQARVMFYIILSLIPVLFLIPLMLGSREMIPADMLPPVEIN